MIASATARAATRHEHNTTPIQATPVATKDVGGGVTGRADAVSIGGSALDGGAEEAVLALTSMVVSGMVEAGGGRFVFTVLVFTAGEEGLAAEGDAGALLSALEAFGLLDFGCCWPKTSCCRFGRGVSAACYRRLRRYPRQPS